MPGKILGIAGWIVLVWLIYIAFSALLVPLLSRRRERTGQWLKDNPKERLYGAEGEAGPDEAAVMPARDDALALRLELLDKATERIDMLYYQLTKDKSGDIILGKLLQRANDGVKVRLVIDSTGYGYRLNRRPIAWALVTHPNVEFRIFGQISVFRPFTIHNLLHEKMILVDRSLLLISGRNIVDRFLTPGHPEDKIVQDFDVLVRTQNPETTRSVMPEAVHHFEDCWNASQTRLPVFFFTKRRRRIGKEKIQTLIDHANRLARSHTTYFGGVSVWDRLVWRPTSRITLIANNVNEIYKTPRLWAEIARLMNTAQEKIYFLSPYFVPVRSMRAFLVDEHLRNTEVHFLTNSPGSTPNLVAFSGYMNRRKFFVDEGRRIFEYQAPGCIHAKLLVFDGRLSMAGSFNCDPRSAYMSCEVMLAIDSPLFAQDLIRKVEEYEKYHALELTRELDYVASEYVTERPASARKRVQLFLFRILAYGIDYLL